MSDLRGVVHVVDDDSMFRDSLANMLRIAGYAVRTHASAGAFLLKAPHGPGCIVLDLDMPGPSGLELHEALAQREDAMPVIFLTGYGDVPSTVRAMKSGAVDFLMKPVDRGTLVAAIDTALERDARQRTERERRAEIERRFKQLSPRERTVFCAVAAGRLNRDIAFELDIAERTARRSWRRWRSDRSPSWPRSPWSCAAQQTGRCITPQSSGDSTLVLMRRHLGTIA
jgi:FixJ family two-component response regulator